MTSGLKLLCAFACLSGLVFLTSCGGSTNSIVNPNPSQPKVEYYYAAGPVDVSTYTVDLGSGSLKKIQTISTNSNVTTLANAFVATSPAKFLYMATPVEDAIKAFAIGSDGTLSEVPGSPFKETAYDSPAYGIVPTGISPSGKDLYAIDYFNEALLHFKIDSSTGALTYVSMVSPGFDPGGLAIDPTGTYLYIPSDMPDAMDPESSGILVYKINAAGNLSLIPGSPFSIPANSQPTGVLMDPSGNFLYVSLFNQGQIVAFRRDQSTGALTEISGSPFATSTVSFPETNSIAMSPSGKFLYAFDLNGNTITGFSIDSASGGLTQIPGSPFKGQKHHDAYVTQGPITMDAFGTYLYVLCNNPQIAAYKIDQGTGALSSVDGSPWNQPENVINQIVVQAP